MLLANSDIAIALYNVYQHLDREYSLQYYILYEGLVVPKQIGFFLGVAIENNLPIY